MSATTWEGSPERPPEAPEPPGRGDPRWMPWTAPVALVTALVAATVGGLIVALVATGFGYELDSGDTPPGVLLPATFLQDLGFVAAALFFARMAGPVRAAQFGLRATRALPAAGWIAAAYVAFLLFIAVWSPLVGMGDAEEQVDGLGVKDSDVALAFGALLVCVVAPVVEELFFRGFFYGALRNWKGTLPAAILTGLVFGAIHFGSADAEALVPLAFFGFVLCLLYERTGSLYPCIALHAINNSIAFGIAVDWSWEIPLLLAGSLSTCLLVARAGAQAFPRGRAVV